VHSGIEIAREQDRAKATEIESWLEQVAENDNILSMGARTFRVSARLMDRRVDLVGGAMIAAMPQFTA